MDAENILGVVEGELRFMPALELPTCLGRESLLQPHGIVRLSRAVHPISVCGIPGQVLTGKEPTEDAGYEIRRDALYMRE